MEFNEHKPIYLQISENICDLILTGEWSEEERIPSVREYGGVLGVNPNTIMRTYDHLQEAEIIYNKRGVGYFISSGAKMKIISIQREQFIDEEVPKIKRRLDLLGLKATDIF
ncbi:MAG: GntR family transcriptional regulator [Bacteroidetes bacterium 41-46]|nr:MAG: GntR family transcriptional regulator [Bacteroidetes bacterium 41-46]